MRLYFYKSREGLVYRDVRFDPPCNEYLGYIELQNDEDKPKCSICGAEITTMALSPEGRFGRCSNGHPWKETDKQRGGE